MTQYVFSQVQKYVRKFNTRDPYEILDALNVVTKMSDVYPRKGLKGYCIQLNRTNYVVINEKLPEAEQRVIASHELGHVTVHNKELRCSPFQDCDIYQATSKMEREANFFGADLLIPDDEVLDLVHSSDADFFNVAKTLCVPCEFFAFKLYSMVERGFSMQMPIGLNSTFLSSKRR